VIDLRKLNSATKYPSIPTYHKIRPGGSRGGTWLEEEVPVLFNDPDTEVIVTEKINGTNGRIIFTDQIPGLFGGLNEGDTRRRWYLIGSREELLTAQGDLIPSDTYGIVTALRPIAEKAAQQAQLEVQGDISSDIVVGYFEVFGKGLPAAQQYTNAGILDAMIFDAAFIPVSILDKPIEEIAHWRDNGGQKFVTKMNLDEFLKDMGKQYGIKSVPFRLGLTNHPLPTGIPETYEWMEQFRESKANLGGGIGRAEGVVIRTPDRKKIAKLRFEDYEKTLRVRR
jgi:hypothetical protein